MTDPSKSTQCKKILEYLQDNTFINAKIARSLFRCERLASRINDLKSRGHDIRTTIVTYKDADGQRVRYAEYSLAREGA